MDATCVKSMLNNLCIFSRNMKSHQQDVEVLVMYVHSTSISVPLNEHEHQQQDVLKSGRI